MHREEEGEEATAPTARGACALPRRHPALPLGLTLWQSPLALFALPFPPKRKCEARTVYPLMLDSTVIYRVNAKGNQWSPG